MTPTEFQERANELLDRAEALQNAGRHDEAAAVLAEAEELADTFDAETDELEAAAKRGRREAWPPDPEPRDELERSATA